MKNNSKKQSDQKGFTLIEVLVVVGIITILLAITLIALNPAQNFASARNTQRSSDVSAILNAIYQYQAANSGSLPSSVSSVTDTPVAIGNGEGEINPCEDLVSSYLADLPVDPEAGVKLDEEEEPFTGNTCDADSFNTGYEISRNQSRFTISAPSAESEAIISVTR
jgi:prepilin-type N-terminal cleavage/methylation domain-containing protein